MIYLTGDTHGDFFRVKFFIEQNKLTEEDILVILGDVGFNFLGAEKDAWNKKVMNKMPPTIFCIHGNHEIRPFDLEGYKEQSWHGGTVYVQKKYSSLIFAKDGEIYDLGGKKVIVIGGAYSIDKRFREPWVSWWPDEQPTPTIKTHVEDTLEKNTWKVDCVFSHTCPARYIPTEAFAEFLSHEPTDYSTEEWLGEIEAKLTYEKWYCGHWHIEKKIDKLHIMRNDFVEFPEKGL